MTIPAFHVEAKLHGFRKTQEGVVVSFVVSPIDMPSQLALDPLGTRYMLAMAAIGDDEQPLQGGCSSVEERAAGAPDSRVAGSNPASSTSSAASQRGKERYRDSPPMQQALIRACRLSDDLRFQQWVAKDTACPATADHAAAYIRMRCCGGGSRGLIGEDPRSYQRFLAVETDYRIAAGEMAEPR